MNPALSRSLALSHIKLCDALEICDGIIFDFYSGLSHMFYFSSKLHVRYLFFSQPARESFPPCMCHLHESLRRDHHLRHFGRLQYGLFLKSIGLTLEQALTYWRTEFTKKMEPDKVCEKASSICYCIHACFLFAPVLRVYFYCLMCYMYVVSLTLFCYTH